MSEHPLKRAVAVERVHRWKTPVGRSKKIRLDLNENNAPLDGSISGLMRTPDNFLIGGYPEYDEFLELLVQYTGYPKQYITLTNGADQAIDLILRLLFGRSDTVVVPSPVFSYYYHVLELASVNVVAPMYQQNGNEYAFPLHQTLGCLSGAAGLVLCYPNNPLGCKIPPADLTELIDRTADLRIPCIVDESYFEYSGSAVERELTSRSHVIVIRSFSKYFGLAGLRLGYVLAAPSISADLLKMRGPWDVNHVAVQAAALCLNRRDVFADAAQELQSNKDQIVQYLREQDVAVSDTSTNFLLLKHRGRTDLCEFLKDLDILASDLTGYPGSGGLLNGMVRVAIPDSKQMPALMSALSDYYGIANASAVG